jgi:hypothetical protein
MHHDDFQLEHDKLCDKGYHANTKFAKNHQQNFDWDCDGRQLEPDSYWGIRRYFQLQDMNENRYGSDNKP